MSFPFDLHSAALSDSHLPCRAHAIPDHAILLKATTQHGRRETACGLTARVQLLPAVTRSWDISGYHAGFHEEHGTIGAGQGRGMACVN